MKKKLHKAAYDFDVHRSYKGGTTTVYMGYVFELCPYHRLANLWGFVAQHRLVAEDTLGRQLKPKEIVHHIDQNPLNNAPDNLQAMSRRDHQILHMRINVEKLKIPLTEEQVQKALQKEGGIKPASRVLGCCHTTLRNRFPELIIPYKRRSPTKIDDPKAIALVLKYAPDQSMGLREVVAKTGMSAATAMRIAKRNGIPWVKKSRKGEKHRTYRGKPVKHDDLLPEPA